MAGKVQIRKGKKTTDYNLFKLRDKRTKFQYNKI